MKIGSYEVSLIEAGDFRLDGGAMFGVVPKILWNRTNPSDEYNRIEMTMRGLLIEGNGRKILVDAGSGDKEGERFADIYAVDFGKNTLMKSLAEKGLQPDAITDVIYTHLHFDHAGGTTRLDGKHAVPVFPNARHYVQRRHWDHAQNPTVRDKASFLPPNYGPVHEAGLLDLVDGDTEVFPGIELIMLDGHTPAMQSLRVFDGNSALWFATDLLPMSAHVPLPYIMGYDLFPMTTLTEKKRLLPRAVDENWIVAYQHDPHVPASRIIRNERGQFQRGETVEIQ